MPTPQAESRFSFTAGARRAVSVLLTLALALMLAGPFLPAGMQKAQAQPSSVPDPDFWVTDGAVWSILPAGNVTYIGGSFTYVGPHTGCGAPVDTSSGSPLEPYPQVEGVIYTTVADGSGGWFIGGSFTRVGGVARNRLAHILSDGSVSDFNPDLNSAVYALALSGSTLYVGGSFTTIQGSSGGPYTRNRLAAIDTATSNPTGFDPDLNGGVSALALSGTTLYAGGDFTTIQGSSGGPYTRDYLASIDTTNSNPTDFKPGMINDGRPRIFSCSNGSREERRSVR
jgi:hypothetical protein